MDFRNVQLPREIHTGPGILNEIGDVCDKLLSHKKVTVIFGPTTKKIAGNQVIEILESKDYEIVELIVSEATDDSVEKVASISTDSSAILGVLNSFL